jgi:ribosomal peptide maturation radical SAM protein 1
MRIVLVAMPWHSLDTPSLAVGILHERVKKCRDSHEVQDVYAHLKWAEYIMARSQGRLKPADYTQVADGGIFYGLGDWIFAPALYGTPEWKVAEYSAYFGKAFGGMQDWLVEMHRWTPDFIERLANQVLALKPDAVGFTSTFMQNVSSLALAKRLKQLAPNVVTMMGGANCDGPQGLALHRNYEFIDFVVRGEGEQTFVELVDALNGHGSFENIEGLCWRKEGKHVANPERKHAFPSAEIPEPNYDAYFAAVSNSPVKARIEPKLVMEGARGCWWGEKHHCTFCGLNGSMMAFRSKSPEQLWREVQHSVTKYQTLDVIMVDNIIDHKYFKGLLPHIAQSGLNLRIHYEVKSNLTADQIHSLRAAGVMNVQPGIENLSSRVLKLMDKGVSGCHNIQTIRECEEQGLTVSWNYLYGFPGETVEDYADIVEQLPALVHLQPPGGVGRISLERFSPNFENPALGFTERKPLPFYSLVYDLPENELMDLAYIFSTPDQGISGEITQRMSRGVAAWRESHLQSELTWREDGQRIYIRDRRVGWTPADHVLASPFELALFRALRRPQSPTTAAGALRAAGQEQSPEEVAAKLAEWRRLGLVFEEDGRFVVLPVRATPLRIRQQSKNRLAPARPEGLPVDGPRGGEVPTLSLAALAAGETLGVDRFAVSLLPEQWERLVEVLEARPTWPALAVVLDGPAPGAWPTAQQLERLVARGVVEVRVPWEMEIGEGNAEGSVHFLRFLRDCTAWRVRVRWSGNVSAPVRVKALQHLEPPESGLQPDALRAWHEAHAYGVSYWRSGPGFAFIKDSRPGPDAVARFTLDDGPLREVFSRLDTPRRVQDLVGDVPMANEALEGLLEEELVLKLGDWAVTLPYQLRRWPIPFSVV